MFDYLWYGEYDRWQNIANRQVTDNSFDIRNAEGKLTTKPTRRICSIWQLQ
jgi:hypothetical protein